MAQPQLTPTVIKRQYAPVNAYYLDELLSQLNESLYLHIAELWKNDDRDRILITVPVIKEQASLYGCDTYKQQAIILLCHPDLALVGDYVFPDEFPGHLPKSYIIGRAYYELEYLNLGNRKIATMKRIS